MKDIVIGSHNPTKIKAVQKVFQHSNVIEKDVLSNVSKQPVGDQETRAGAINRARYAQQYKPGSIGIGLEGGVMEVSDRLFLCSWGALQTADNRQFTAAGARIELPQAFEKKLNQRVELSDIMNAYTAQKDLRHHEGAIGIFTDDLVDRSTMFEHIVTLLKGQYIYWSKKGS